MPIPTTRAKENGLIRIDQVKCNGCGLCVSVCSDDSLLLIGKQVVVNKNAIFGCIGCGHCMAICPEDAIEVSGRTISSNDMYNLPPKESTANYEQIMSLYQRRRSIRKFRDTPIEPEIIGKIIDAAQTAPMGIPPSDVHLMVLKCKEESNAFARDYCQYLKKMKWFVSPWFLALMRPLWGKANDDMFRSFIRPMFRVYTEEMKQGNNVINYDAPLVIYFYGSPYADPADPIVAATYAMIAAESLGLGTIMLGAVHPMIQQGRQAKMFREKYRIRYASREGLFVAFGYPAFKYRKGIKRTFAAVH